MNQATGQIIIGDMVKAILYDQPGSIMLGNVLMLWDGQRLRWDLPLSEWDIEAVIDDLMAHAERNVHVERIALCAEALARL